MTPLACTVSQKSLTKNFIIQSMERKKIGQIQGRISRRRLVCNSTIQHVIINLYTKYDSSSLQGCGEIFDEKVLRNYGRTDGRKDGMTDRCKPVYPPLFQSGGIIIKDGLPYLFHSFRNKYFYKISLGSMLYFQNKFTSFEKMHGFPTNMQ